MLFGGSQTSPFNANLVVSDITQRVTELSISVYDRRPGLKRENFLGHVMISIDPKEQLEASERWIPLCLTDRVRENNTSEILVKMQYSDVPVTVLRSSDFRIQKLIGRGVRGQVYCVRKVDTNRAYAMKVLSKKLITSTNETGKRHISIRTAEIDSSFIAKLRFSFQTVTDLNLVVDFISGGELFWHLQREGRFQENQAKFYIAQIILVLKDFHKHGIIYRDLRPELFLLDMNGYLVLSDFGVSEVKLFANGSTCCWTEYLAPEALLELEHNETVDFWSLGVLIFEMCCGWSPFYAEDSQQMYKNISFGKIRFPRDALSTEGRALVKGLLNRNPAKRLGANQGAAELMAHPFFTGFDWEGLRKRTLRPPIQPKHIQPTGDQAIDDQRSLNSRAFELAQGHMGFTSAANTMVNAFKGFTFVDQSADDSTLANAFKGFTFVDESAQEAHFTRRADDTDIFSDESWHIEE